MRKSKWFLIILLLFVPFVLHADETAENRSLLKRIEVWYGENMNYGSITALMAVESSFIPFPSEVVVPPAVYVAGNEDSVLNVTDSYPLNVLLIVLFASVGALIGAIINYALSIWLGRPIIYKFADSKVGHLFLLSGDKIQRAEQYFNEHGKISTFIGRLIPAVRQLISIPAGLARMPFGTFVGYTFLGAFSWNVVLALIGYVAHGQADLIDRYNKELSIAVVVLLIIVLAGWGILKAVKRKPK
ncbi:MAG: DedA family protein [Paludibacteraceae bacterium]|nr:DedA family protein [Paludibacteraceae bacterium]